jgi:hypothetical protein
MAPAKSNSLLMKPWELAPKKEERMEIPLVGTAWVYHPGRGTLIGVLTSTGEPVRIDGVGRGPEGSTFVGVIWNRTMSYRGWRSLSIGTRKQWESYARRCAEKPVPIHYGHGYDS